MDEFVRIGEEAARKAGALLRERFNTRFSVEQKGVINLVTEVDLAAEKLIVSHIRGAFPDHAILAEEGHSDTESGPTRWIIDPLDGTTNYAHGYPVFAVSIGIEIDGKIEWGAVYDPMRDELFTARRGAGARLNGVPLRVSETAALNESLLATGFPYDIRTGPRKNLAEFSAFAVLTHGVRRGGSAALDLCYVAAGRLDGFWEHNLRPWDCAAGYLAVREAGGIVTDYSGNQGSIYVSETLASNGRIHEEMKAVLEKAQAKS
ncbi:MAG: inositol monophosphatase [Acidobacteriota bacterium]|nr:inositol monophosphatase [Acidobacteriota bacterium]